MGKRGMTPLQAQMLRKEQGLNETKLQRLRVARGLSQAELAKLSGITKRMIQLYEQRQQNIDGAKLPTLCSLSAVLGCKIEDLLESKKMITMYRSTK